MKKQNIDTTGLKQTFLGFSLALIVMFVIIAGVLFAQTIYNNESGMLVLEDNVNGSKQAESTQGAHKNKNIPSETLSTLDEYQARYF
ncbi:MAG: hypothetical protein NC311_19855 [Muribaculaceae bacterium]|nr:hypothetical protein [Muribaculaceae bacterium]